jgi:hypothetical protein
MSERKYRQRGYMDGDRPSRPAAKPQPHEPRPERIGPRPLNMPGFREVTRCARCAALVTTDEVRGDARCSKCGADLHACVQCTHFDSASRFECRQPIAARVAPKDARNECPSFESQRRVERETGSAAPSDARKAFDDLFK